MKSDIGNRTSRVAFTLVELLVVVTIIVILLALLTPAMDSAMEAALRAKCAANLHVFGVAHHHYGMDHKRKLLRVVLFRPNGPNRIYPSLMRNTDSQGPGQWSAEKMGPYIGGVDPNIGDPVRDERLLGEQWYCPSNGKTAAKDAGNQLSSLAPNGDGLAGEAGWFAMDYAYFARIEPQFTPRPWDLIGNSSMGEGLLMADTIYHWQGGGHDSWWFNHHVDGPSVHDEDRQQWGGPVMTGEAIRGLSGTNQLLGNGAVIWKDGSKFGQGWTGR
jgi:competence protein ComGC